MRSTLAVLTLFAATVHAQSGYPAYIGQLLVQPGLSSAHCMTAASDTENAAVTIQPCTGAKEQKWVFSGGAVRIFDNKCLDVTGAVNVKGTKLQIRKCVAGAASQAFFYSFWNYTLKWKNTDKCVDLSKGNLDSGTPIQIWDCSFSINRVWNTGYLSTQLPDKSEKGQYGTNKCSGDNYASSKCQTAWINSATDFCLWGPPNPNSLVGDTEPIHVTWCLQNRGARAIPAGTLKGVHFVKTKDYVQITGVGDFTKMNIRKNDDGGELDPHGADGNGNPVGGLVYGTALGQVTQYHEWTSFMSHNEFCFRACVGANAAQNCQHIYDVMGCTWNMPANYKSGIFESCDGENALPMGVYGSSTWRQGVKPTPKAHPVPKSSNCKTMPTITSVPKAVVIKRGLEGRAPEPTMMG